MMYYQQQSLQPSLIPSNMLANQPNRQPPGGHFHELFVGNLSYFCEEHHLFELFREYAAIKNVQVVRNENATRSLQFGFVAVASIQEAKELCKLYHNHLFMGRKLKVELCDNSTKNHVNGGHSSQHSSRNVGHQIHVSFSSNFSAENLIRPTEALLRRHFMHFGSVVDVAVREYAFHDKPLRQDGYAFVTFEDPSAVMAAVSPACASQNVEGITLVCTMTHNQGSQKKLSRHASYGCNSLNGVNNNTNNNELTRSHSLMSLPVTSPTFDSVAASAPSQRTINGCNNSVNNTMINSSNNNIPNNQYLHMYNLAHPPVNSQGLISPPSVWSLNSESFDVSDPLSAWAMQRRSSLSQSLSIDSFDTTRSSSWDFL